MFKNLIRRWEVLNRIPEMQPNAIVGMSIAHKTDGSAGIPFQAILDECTAQLLAHRSSFGIFSNRMVQNSVNIARLAKSVLTQRGISPERILIPTEGINSRISNTYMEAEYALRACKEKDFRSLLIVANHLHMRRVLAAFRMAMLKTGINVTLYWKSVGHTAYGKKGSAQRRFDHPLSFLAYEWAVAVYSKCIGWW